MEGLHNYFIKNEDIINIKELDYSKESEIIYEVVRIIDGVSLFLEDHYFRFKQTFEKRGKNIPISLDELREKLEKLCETNKVNIGNVKIIYPISEEVIYYFFIPHSYPTDEMYKQGVKGIIFNAERNNPGEKIVNNTLRESVNLEIKEKGAYEALLVDREGYITEGSRSNVFMIKNNKLITTPVEKVLPGVTRKRILQVAKQNNIEILEDRIKVEELKDVDVVFISGTSPKILPFKNIEKLIFKLDNNILKSLMSSYDKEIKKYIMKNRTNKNFQ